ncbi:cytochrome c oxidase assembly protein [Lentibacillus kapialis]|uniref:cytochrome c oxidase assembly protein n=1 Tax=Lentibacillus kapialis TaxID=340214 RepID=UPI00166A741C|nr:cytochrome c oxidase assembly protein [Lentibacillus kapialis]
MDALLLEQFLVWNIPLLAGCLLAGILYVYLFGRFKRIDRGRRKSLFFFIALISLYAVTGSPLEAVSHLAFSLHMLQMSLLYFIIPPLLLLGIPDRLYRRIRELRILQAISNGKRFYPSKISLLMFGALFLLYHLPFVLDLLAQYPLIQNVYSAILFLLAVSMWMPIISPDPNERLSRKEMKRYAWLSGAIIMPACLVFISNAFIGGMANSFGSQLTGPLCIPVQREAVNGLLPYPFHTEYEQAFAGVLMLGMHKASILISCHIGNKDR